MTPITEPKYFQSRSLPLNPNVFRTACSHWFLTWSRWLKSTTSWAFRWRFFLCLLYCTTRLLQTISTLSLIFYPIVHDLAEDKLKVIFPSRPKSKMISSLQVFWLNLFILFSPLPFVPCSSHGSSSLVCVILTALGEEISTYHKLWCRLQSPNIFRADRSHWTLMCSEQPAVTES